MLKIFTTFSKSFKSFFPFFLKKKKRIENVVSFQNHLDSNQTKEQKVKSENRRRNQAYIALDYILSSLSYFDFFSLDAFKIAKDAKNITQIVERNFVPSEFLLLSFFYTNSPLITVLQNFGITKEKIEKKILFKMEKSNKKNIFVVLKESIEKLPSLISFKSKEISINNKIKFSLEVNRIFEKASENALDRFKNPVIGTEILFLTMMEDENTSVGKLIKTFFENETDWLLLRYNLIKRLHKQESHLRKSLAPNAYFFGYLLKTRFSDKEFENLIESSYLKQTVSKFRNELISEILKLNIYDLLKKEVFFSIYQTKKNFQRNYSLDS